MASKTHRVNAKTSSTTTSDTLIGAAIVALVTASALYLGPYFALLGSAILGMMIGLTLRNAIGIGIRFEHVSGFCTKRLLKVAIICLGGTFTFQQAIALGRGYFLVVVITILIALVTAYISGRLLDTSRFLSALIGAGTAICGATAILALGPVIRAKREETTYAITTIFLFNLIAMLLFPIIGHLLQIDEVAFGAWAGAAIHDTSSVLASAFAYGDVAGQTAVVVKLSRTLMLLPLLIGAFLFVRKRNEVTQSKQALIKSIPWFILAFIAMSLLASLGVINEDARQHLGTLSKLLIIVVLSAVGLSTELASIRNLGWKPLIVACGASVLTAVISFFAITQLS